MQPSHLLPTAIMIHEPFRKNRKSDCNDFCIFVKNKNITEASGIFMNRRNFIAIDFETATSRRSSICEVGICVVRDGKVAETRSWLVRPEDNRYHYWNIKVHGIRPEDTEDAPDFAQVWEEIERTYLDEFDTFVAHNVPFDRSCLMHSADLYRLHLPRLEWRCSLATARRIYSFSRNSLGYLCDRLNIPQGTHHSAGDDAEMCARLYLRELADME